MRKGWEKRLSECAKCGRIGYMRKRGEHAYCVACKGKRARYLTKKELKEFERLESPPRKIKGRCRVCGRRTVGDYCFDCYDASKIWDKEKKLEQSEKLKEYWEWRRERGDMTISKGRPGYRPKGYDRVISDDDRKELLIDITKELEKLPEEKEVDIIEKKRRRKRKAEWKKLKEVV